MRDRPAQLRAQSALRPLLLLLLLCAASSCGRLGIRLVGASHGPGRDAGDGGRIRDAGVVIQDAGVDGATDPYACQVVCENDNGLAECRADSCSLTCSIGYADCDGQASNGCETSVASTVDHCGKCTMPCANDHGAVMCAEGLCIPSCSGDFADCDGMARNGCETDLNTVEHCGECGIRCTNAHGGTSCIAGVCVPSCDAGFTDCDGAVSNGCEANTDSDPRHCGTCTTKCNFASQVCVGGSCEISPCGPGLGECDADPGVGCETDIQSSLQHCGFCGNECTTANGSPQCVGGECLVASCDASFGDCDDQASTGCETPLASTSGHCGACDRACMNAHGTTTCSGSDCVPACSSEYGDCDASRQNGCETQLNTVSHCGACGMTCAPNGGTPVCNAGVCGTVCDLSGNFALKLTTPTTWPGTIYIQGSSGSFTHWMLLQMNQNGTSLSGSVVICGHTVPDFSGSALSEDYGLTYPNAAYDSALAPSTSTSATLGGLGPGSSFVLARSALMVGAQMADPVNGAWPSRTSLTNLNADWDNDGKPGITGNYKNGGGYSYVPVNSFANPRATRGYLASRLVFQLNGTLTSCSQSSGAATVNNLNFHTLGCLTTSNNRDCDDGESNNLDTRAPGFQPQAASYRLAKISDATCPAVRAALP